MPRPKLLSQPIITDQPEPDNRPNNTLIVKFISMGQGDCITIKTPLGRTWMVDCGSKASKNHTSPGDPILQVLGLRYVHTRDAFNLIGKTALRDVLIQPEYATLDFLVLTHSDTDHYNTLPHFFDNTNITQSTTIRRIISSVAQENFAFNKGRGKTAYLEDVGAILNKKLLAPSTTKNPSVNKKNLGWTVVEHDHISNDLQKNLVYQENFGRGSKKKTCKFYLFHSGQNAALFNGKKSKKRKRNDDDMSFESMSAAEQINASSVMLYIEFGQEKILLTGDANRFSAKFIQHKYSNIPIGQLSLLQVPHHGAAENQIDIDFIEELSPKSLVASAPTSGIQVHHHPRFITLFDWSRLTSMQPYEGNGKKGIYCWIQNGDNGIRAVFNGKSNPRKVEVSKKGAIKKRRLMNDDDDSDSQDHSQTDGSSKIPFAADEINGKFLGGFWTSEKDIEVTGSHSEDGGSADISIVFS